MKVSYAIERVQKYYPKQTAEAIHSHLHYSTLVNYERKYLYFEVPKAACTSMKTLIHKLENLPPINSSPMPEVRRDMYIHNRGDFRMKSLVSFSNEIQEEILNDPNFFRFTIVRNPFTRLESGWRDKVQTCAPRYEYFYNRLRGRLPNPGETESLIKFPEFVREIAGWNLDTTDGHFRRQVSQLYYPAIPLSFVGKVESLAYAQKTILERMGFDANAPHEKLNVTERSSEYTEETVDIVRRLYSEDFSTFGYDPQAVDELLEVESGGVPKVVSERKFLSEVMERNIILGKLYHEVAKQREAGKVKGEDALLPLRTTEFDKLYEKHIAPADGWLDKPEAMHLFEAARSVKSGCIVEIGAYRGRSTLALGLGANAGTRPPIYSIDPHDPFVGPGGGKFTSADRDLFMRRMIDTGLSVAVHLINLSSEFLAEFWPQPVSLLWIDGDHRYEAVKRDWKAWRNKLADDAVIMFGGASRAKNGPNRVIDEILAADPRFAVTARFGELAEIRRTN